MKRKLSTDGKLFFADIILILVIIIEIVAIILRVNATEHIIKGYFMLYKGCEIKMTTGTQNPLDFATELEERASNKKYNTTYYNYENGKYDGESDGKFKYENGGYMNVENVSKIAFSKNIKAIPREHEVIEDLPEELSELKNYTNVEIHKLDTDGDGTTEYIVCTQDSKSSEETEDGEPTAYSAITLYAYDFTKISDLVIIEDGIYHGYATAEERDENKVLLDLSMVEYVDYDEDNIMEIIVDVPQWEEMLIDIFKYSAYELSGEKIVMENVNP